MIFVKKKLRNLNIEAFGQNETPTEYQHKSTDFYGSFVFLNQTNKFPSGERRPTGEREGSAAFATLSSPLANNFLLFIFVKKPPAKIVDKYLKSLWTQWADYDKIKKQKQSLQIAVHVISDNVP